MLSFINYILYILHYIQNNIYFLNNLKKLNYKILNKIINFFLFD